MKIKETQIRCGKNSLASTVSMLLVNIIKVARVKKV